MSFSDLSQLITAIAALGAVFMSARNGRKADRTEQAIQEVHLSINSRMDQLLEEAKKTAHAAGVTQQRMEDKIR